MEELGVVSRVQNGRAFVLITKGDAKSCEGCTACASIGGGDFEIAVQNSMHAAVGDTVRIAIDRFSGLAYVPIYLLPLLLMIMGYYVFPFILDTDALDNESVGIIGAFTFFMVYLVALYFVFRRVGNRKERARMIAVLSKGENRST